MGRPEHLAAIGLRIQYLQEAIRSSLLTSIYLLVQEYLDEERFDNFTKFYQQMILGVTEEARERGEVARTINELQAYIRDDMDELPESVKSICLNLVERMRRPPPMEI